MLYVFIATGLMGYAWAYSFYRTRSILLGVGMHLGWNFASSLFSRGPLGEIMFVETSYTEIPVWLNVIYSFSTIILIPVTLIFFIKYYCRSTQKVIAT